MKMIAVAAVLLSLSSASSLAQTTPSSGELNRFVLAAKGNLLEQLKDPDSAKFKSLTVHRHAGPDGTSELMLCGEVNAKNSHGGYVGFTAFISSTGSMVYTGSQIDVLLPEYCGAKIADVK